MKLDQCFHWSFTLTDLRRKTLNGMGVNKHIVTGVHARAHGMHDTRAASENTFHPTLIEDDTVVDASEPLPENQLQVSTKAFNGWRVSYRLETPDQESHQVWKDRMKKRFQRYEHLMQHLRASGRHWSMKEKLKRQR
eukprot:4592010-Lingulodinium_polyedra.AAC.1